MIGYLDFCILVSLFCTGVHVSFLEGNLLFPVKQFFDKRLKYTEPFYDCLTCMGGLYTALAVKIFSLPYHYLVLIPCVIGINTILENVINSHPNEP